MALSRRGKAAIPSKSRAVTIRLNHHPSSDHSAFAGYRFPPEIIMLAVRWYLRYGLSYRDVEELLAERCIEVDHVTIYRWVQKFAPLLIDVFRPCRHIVGNRWLVDEAYVKVAGTWRYVDRAVDHTAKSLMCSYQSAEILRPAASSSIPHCSPTTHQLRS